MSRIKASLGIIFIVFCYAFVAYFILTTTHTCEGLGMCS